MYATQLAVAVCRRRNVEQKRMVAVKAQLCKQICCSMQGGHRSHLRLIARICSPKPGIMRVHTCVSCTSDHCSGADAVCHAVILDFVPACSLTLRGGHAWTGTTSASRQSQYRFCGLRCHVPRRWASAARGDHHAAGLCVHLWRRHTELSKVGHTRHVKLLAGPQPASSCGCRNSIPSDQMQLMHHEGQQQLLPPSVTQHGSIEVSASCAAHQIPEDSLDLILLIWHEPVLRFPSAHM
jgi:hypothetical protein